MLLHWQKHTRVHRIQWLAMNTVAGECILQTPWLQPRMMHCFRIWWRGVLRLGGAWTEEQKNLGWNLGAMAGNRRPAVAAVDVSRVMGHARNLLPQLLSTKCVVISCNLSYLCNNATTDRVAWRHGGGGNSSPNEALPIRTLDTYVSVSPSFTF